MKKSYKIVFLIVFMIVIICAITIIIIKQHVKAPRDNIQIVTQGEVNIDSSSCKENTTVKNQVLNKEKDLLIKSVKDSVDIRVIKALNLGYFATEVMYYPTGGTAVKLEIDNKGSKSIEYLQVRIFFKNNDDIISVKDAIIISAGTTSILANYYGIRTFSISANSTYKGNIYLVFNKVEGKDLVSFKGRDNINEWPEGRVYAEVINIRFGGTENIINLEKDDSLSIAQWIDNVEGNRTFLENYPYNDVQTTVDILKQKHVNYTATIGTLYDYGITKPVTKPIHRITNKEILDDVKKFQSGKKTSKFKEYKSYSRKKTKRKRRHR